MKRIVSVLILLGALSFTAAIVQKIAFFYLTYFPGPFIPLIYLRLSSACLFLAIALSAREIAFKEK